MKVQGDRVNSTSNSYTMVCPPVPGNKPPVLARRLSPDYSFKAYVGTVLMRGHNICFH